MKDEYAELAISNKRLKASKILGLNDPFELLPNVREKKHRLEFEKFKKEMSDEYFLFCFSSNSRSPQMWAHYANNHNGVCLEFFIQENPHVINYIKNRTKFDPFINLKDESSKLKFMNHLVTIKDKRWEYEEECRLLKHKNSLLKDGNDFFFEFEACALELRGVYLGMESPTHNEQKYKALLAHYEYPENIQVKRVRKAYGTYSMTTYPHKSF